MTVDDTPSPYRGRRIVTVVQDLRGGGAERISVFLANGMAEAGAEMTLVLFQAKGPFLEAVSPKVKVIELGSSRTFKAIPALALLFRRLGPDAIIAHMTHVNVAVLLAALLAGCPSRTVLVEHNQFDLNFALKRGSVRLAYRLARRLYRLAGAVVAVSEGVADTLARCTSLPRAAIHVAYNPVVTEEIFHKAEAGLSHPFLDGRTPVVLGIGKLSPQKDFLTFLEAIALARRRRPLRAIILGQGMEHDMLVARRTALGLDDAVDLAGFVDNPYCYIARSDLFLLSSRWEGLPTVVIEAIALGANAVCTDCPSGPREILGGDRLGRLVPVGDAPAMAEAVLDALKTPPDPGAARARGRDFTLPAALAAYGKVIAAIVG